jgi:hypothetical protein
MLVMHPWCTASVAVARNANGTPTPDLAPYGEGWITKVGFRRDDRPIVMQRLDRRHSAIRTR